jgi:hypothetical protein
MKYNKVISSFDEYIKTYEGFFNEVDHVHNNLEVNIKGIFVDMLDEGFILETRLDNYASNISDVYLRNRLTTKPFSSYLDIFRHFHDYLTYNKYKFFNISINGKWILDKSGGRAFQFTGDWESISNKLLIESEGIDFKSINISFCK